MLFWFHLYETLGNTDLNSSVMDVTRACGLTGKWQRQHFGVMAMPSIMPLVVVMWVNKFAKIDQTIYLICVLFAVWNLALNKVDLKKTPIAKSLLKQHYHWLSCNPCFKSLNFLICKMRTILVWPCFRKYYTVVPHYLWILCFSKIT